MDGFSRSMVEVSVTRPWRPASGPTSIVHQTQALTQQDVTTVAGIPVTGVARTLADLGIRRRSPLVDRGARRRPTAAASSLRWIQSTAERLHRPGQAGTGVVLALLEAAWRRADRPGLVVRAARRGVPRARRELPTARAPAPGVRRPAAAWSAILDLAFPSLRLGVEAHSRQFHFGRLPQQADEDRDHRLARCGWEVLYVGWQATRRPADLLALVVETTWHRRSLVA